MGRPNELGPAQPQNVLGRSRPNKNLVFLFWARPGPEGRAGPGSAWPINKTSWARTSLAQHKKLTGELFSPHPPACRTNLLHAEGNAGDKSKMRGKESLPGAEEAVALVCRLRWRCCGGGRWRCQAALWFQRQLQAVILSPTFFPVPCCSFVFSRSLAVSSFPSSQCWVFGVSLLCFG